MTQTSKKHHYLPQFYIAGFTNEDGDVFVLEHETGKINKQSKNGTFHKYKYYTVDFTKHEKRDPEVAQRMRKALGIENVDTSKVKEYPDMIEDLLGESETLAAPIIKKLITREQIYDTEKIELSTFIAFMYTRNPAFHNFATKMEERMMEESIQKVFSKKDTLRESYNEMLKEGKDIKVSLEDVLKFVEEKKYKIEIPKELNIQTMLIGTSTIDRILYNKTWLILEAPKDTSFITNNNPVFIDHPIVDEKGPFAVGFETPGAQVFFPLSKECLLVMMNTSRGRTIGYKKVDKVRVRELNARIFERSDSHVIARDFALIKRLKK